MSNKLGIEEKLMKKQKEIEHSKGFLSCTHNQVKVQLHSH